MSLTTDDIAKFWDVDTLRQREELLRGYSGFEVYCGECRYVLAEPGPGCCRYVAPRSSWWRRLFRVGRT
jgi:hypothetical protein